MTGRGADRQATHRGVRWRRDDDGAVSFYDDSSRRWVKWARGVDAPPLPPRWQLLGVPTKVARPGWRSPWRVVPAMLVLVAVVIAIFQSVLPSESETTKQSKAAAALVGRCLARDGTFEGHPKYRASPVACTSGRAAAKVVTVVASTPGSALCPSGTTGMELAYSGVADPKIDCLQPLAPTG
jgi:hypothetical protein